MKYRVRVSNDFRATTSANRMIAGLSIPQDGDGLLIDLTNEQLDELKADRYVSVTTEDGEPVEGQDGEVTATSTEAQDAQAAEELRRQEQEQTENESQSDSGTDDDATGHKYSMSELREQAEELGVAKNGTKQELAQRVADARAAREGAQSDSETTGDAAEGQEQAEGAQSDSEHDNASNEA